jgi:hypothetical protein
VGGKGENRAGEAVGRPAENLPMQSPIARAPARNIACADSDIGRVEKFEESGIQITMRFALSRKPLSEVCPTQVGMNSMSLIA